MKNMRDIGVTCIVGHYGLKLERCDCCGWEIHGDTENGYNVQGTVLTIKYKGRDAYADSP